MATRIELDTPRRIMTEVPFHKFRSARRIDSTLTKNRIFQWPGTGSWTLHPINFTTDFVETASWEALKFRLADVNYVSGWWNEVPRNTRTGVGPADYYLNGKVSDANWSNDLILDNLLGFTTSHLAYLIALRALDPVNVLYSKATMPANAGFFLKFFLEGRRDYQRGSVLIFYFGEYALNLNSNGVAELHKATDPTRTAWEQVYQFHWAGSSEVHGRNHHIAIVPHGRNCIEFLSSTSAKLTSRAQISFNNAAGADFYGLYRIPGNASFDGAGNPIITQAGRWRLDFSREFRPFVQVSRFGYFNGGDGLSILYDNPVGLPQACSMPISVQPAGDYNGGNVSWFLLDGESGAPYAAGNTVKSVQFGVKLRGAGDVAGPGLASTVTPEIYGYGLYKAAKFETPATTPVTSRVMKIEIDQGDAPEAERLSIHCDNGDGQLDDYRRRSDIPVRLYDDETEITYFEGTALSVQSGEAKANNVPFLAIEVAGMADDLLRLEWDNSPPDPMCDPDDPNVAWYWMHWAKHVFGVGGFDPDTQVVIEDASTGTYNFRLWASGGSGGTKGGNAPSAEHVNGSGTTGSRYKPTELTTVYEYQDWFLRQIMGWHWVWDRSDHKWHLYKRPDPRLAIDAARLQPKVAFYRTEEKVREAPDGLPSYAHSQISTETRRPYCNSLKCFSYAQDQAASGPANSPENRPEDVKSESRLRLLPVTLTNYNSLASASKVNNPDYLGRLRLRPALLREAMNTDALEWMARRLFDDNCFGHVFAMFQADWGDPHTAYLRKYDVVLIDTKKSTAEDGTVTWSMERWFIERIEPQWNGGGSDKNIRARYRCVLLRDGVLPPR